MTKLVIEPEQGEQRTAYADTVTVRKSTDPDTEGQWWVEWIGPFGRGGFSLDGMKLKEVRFEPSLPG
jgi:hypothetical protein